MKDFFTVIGDVMFCYVCVMVGTKKKCRSLLSAGTSATGARDAGGSHSMVRIFDYMACDTHRPNQIRLPKTSLQVLNTSAVMFICPMVGHMNR